MARALMEPLPITRQDVYVSQALLVLSVSMRIVLTTAIRANMEVIAREDTRRIPTCHVCVLITTLESIVTINSALA